MSKFIVSFFVFILASYSQGSTCNIAKIGDDSVAFEAVSLAYNPNLTSFSISTPSADYSATVTLQDLDGTTYRKVTLSGPEQKLSALFSISNPHIFVSLIKGESVVQLQCWIAEP